MAHTDRQRSARKEERPAIRVMYVYFVVKKLSDLMDRRGLLSVFQKVSHFELA
jgi:hypothetical protein